MFSLPCLPLEHLVKTPSPAPATPPSLPIPSSSAPSGIRLCQQRLQAHLRFALAHASAPRAIDGGGGQEGAIDGGGGQGGAIDGRGGQGGAARQGSTILTTPRGGGVTLSAELCLDDSAGVLDDSADVRVFMGSWQSCFAYVSVSVSESKRVREYRV